MSVVFKAVGRPDLALKLAASVIPLYLTAVWVGAVTGGIVGVAIGVTLSRTLGGMVSFWASSRLLGQPVSRCLKELGEPLLASMPMVVFLVILKFGFAHLDVSEGFELATFVAFGATIYLMTLRLGFEGLASDVIELSSSLSPRLGAAARGLLAPA